MTHTTGEALAISVPQPVKGQDRVSDWTRLAHGRSLAEPLGPASGQELVTAIEEKREQDTASEARGSQRWRALDQLLRVSFGSISPAYLFDSYPPVQ